MYWHSTPRRLTAAVTAAVLAIFGQVERGLALPQSGSSGQLGDIFVIDLENHNWTQPDGNVAAAPVNGVVNGGTTSSGGIEQIYGNPAAPFINSLVTPGNPNAAQVSYSNSNYNVLSTPSGNNASIHPSELNYIWQETGNNDGVVNDNDPYGGGGNVAVVQSYLSSHPAVSGQHLTGMLQTAGLSWKSYDEDANLQNTTGGNANINGTLTSTPVAPGSTTVPLTSFSGSSDYYTNPYNGSHQYNFATKHVGSLFFTDTNGGDDTSTANVEASHYAPLQQLQTDLTNNTVSRYNLIVPDQYNDMHTGLGGFTYNGIRYGGDASQIAQGDNFLSIVVPEIEASAAYKNNGAIVIWTDETEQDSTGGSQNNYTHTLTDIVISPLAKGNAYLSNEVYTHSSDLATMQEIFGLTNTPAGLLNDAGNPNTNDLSDFFVAGAIPDPNAVFLDYAYRGGSGTTSAPATGKWSASSSWSNGVAPTTSINKELDFLDSGSSGYTATDDIAGVFSMNLMVLGNNTGNTDAIANASGSSLSLAGAACAITQEGSGAFVISAPIAIAMNPLTINGTGTGALAISGAISGTGFNLVLGALNVTTLSGANTYTGTTTISSGTLVLDYTSQKNSKVSTASPLVIGSGTLQVNGNTAGAFTQTVAGLNLSGGAATVSIVSGQTSLVLGAISVTTGSSVNFINNGTGTNINTSTGVEFTNNYGTGILGAYAIYNGTTWATLASSSSTNIVGFTAFNSTNGSTGTIDPVRESLDITSSNNNFNSVQETLRYNTSAAITTTIGSSYVNFSGIYAGILMTANVGANNNVIQGNLLEASGDFYIHQFDTLGTLTISSQFTAVGSPSYNLIKTGPGTLILSFNGTESYNGNVYLTGGLISTQYPGDLQNTLVFNGGGLQPLLGMTVANNAIINPGGGSIDVPPGFTSLLSGSYSGLGTLTKTDLGTAILSTTNSYSGGTTVNAGTLTFAAAGAFPVETSLTINSGATAIAANSSGGVKNNLFTTNLTIAATGKLDLNNNDMVVSQSTLTAVNALVAQGFNNGTWTGDGITSTAAAANSTHLTALGVIQNSVDGTATGTILYSAFDGYQDGDETDVLIKYTYVGDANLDGKVDGSDYSRIDNGYLHHLTGWFNGDFNYDGVVNGSDYTLIDNAFNMQNAAITGLIAPPNVSITSEIATITAVPEPATVGLLVLVTMGTLGRRRSRGLNDAFAAKKAELRDANSR
jgi:autotransporter-associated beta strand protein